MEIVHLVTWVMDSILMDGLISLIWIPLIPVFLIPLSMKDPLPLGLNLNLTSMLDQLYNPMNFWRLTIKPTKELELLSDLSVNQINSTLLGGTSWAAGKYGQSVSLDGINDKVEINPESSLMNLHKSSYSISMWINPADPSPGKYTKNRLAVRGYRVAMSDSYFTNLPSIYNLPSSGSSFFTGGPGGRGFDFQSDSDFISAGTGVGNDNYMVLFTGSFQAKASGDYNWEILGNDDRGALWIDLDQNGIFELNGNQGDERVLDAANGFANTSTTLSPGFYRIALIHGEKTGSSSQQLQILHTFD